VEFRGEEYHLAEGILSAFLRESLEIFYVTVKLALHTGYFKSPKKLKNSSCNWKLTERADVVDSCGIRTFPQRQKKIRYTISGVTDQ
jgi:hypothetical protein